MELFEEIRREYEFGEGTIQGVARKFGVHRRLVREALTTPVPQPKAAPPRPRPRLGPLVDLIDTILDADRRAPRKQRHTAHRIWVRLSQERPGPGGAPPVAESTVREYVHARKRALGLLARETFVPQSYAWGEEAQVDWYEAVADRGDERALMQVFSMRSMASGAAFHCAYRHATQQAFLEAHQLAFHYFGGVFRRLRYDNLTAAVKRILRGSQREETQRFVAFRSHWRFEAVFCTPAEAHEKGGVENEVGTFRRNHWVPVPQAADLADLNAQLLAACRADEARVLAGRSQSVGALLLIERGYLLALPDEDFDLAETSFPTVNSLGCVKVRTNSYSVPLACGTQVQVKLRPAVVEIWHGGQQVGVHERCYGRYQEILDLEHYLDVLERKPGALAGSKPLAQWRQSGRWPQSYDQLWEALIGRYGRQKGTKEMIELLRLGRQHGPATLRAAIEQALGLGCADSAAVRHLVLTTGLARAPVAAIDVGALVRFERPPPAVDAYDQLLVVGGAR